MYVGQTRRDRSMDERILSNAIALRVPPEMLEWLRNAPDLECAWRSCADPEWFLALARVADTPVPAILRALATCFPIWRPVTDPDPETARIDAIVRQLVQEYAGDGPTVATSRHFKSDVLPKLRDWNIARDYAKHGPIEGIPEPPPNSLWPLINRTNAAAKLHGHASDHARWPWPGAITLVVRWLVQEQCTPADWTLPFSDAQLVEIRRKLPLVREGLVSQLRSLLSEPPAS